MAARHTLQATTRTVIGKETAKLRREGIVPAVIYGPVVEKPLSVSVDMRELDRMYHAYGANLLIDLRLEGLSHTVYMKTVSIDRLKRQPIHAEFYAPNMRVAITGNVPVIHIGEVSNDSGVILNAQESVELRGLPDALPPAVEVDISVLREYDDAIYARDLVLPEGVELLTDPDAMLVKLNAPALITDDEEGDVDADGDAEAGDGSDNAAEAGGTDSAGDGDDSGNNS